MLLALPPLLAVGTAVFAWSVTRAIRYNRLQCGAAVLIAILLLFSVWLLESFFLERRLEKPFADVFRLDVLSWIPLIILPISAPYFSRKVATVFLPAGSSSTRVLFLAFWLLGLAVAGSLILKLLLFWKHSQLCLKYIERYSYRVMLALTAFYFIAFTALAFLAYYWFNGLFRRSGGIQ